MFRKQVSSNKVHFKSQFSITICKNSIVDIYTSTRLLKINKNLIYRRFS